PCSLHATLPHHPPPPFPTRRSSDLNLRALCVPHVPLQFCFSPCRHGELALFQFHEHLPSHLAQSLKNPASLKCNRLKHWLIPLQDRKSTRLNSSHRTISYAVFCLKK